jgi:hypothetical protein
MRRLRSWLFAVVALLAGSGCTLITEAGEYEVSAFSPHLELVLIGMSPHAGIPVDVAVVSEEEQLLGRAIVVMPDEPPDEYPDESITLDDVLVPGQNRIFFFADADQDGLFDPPMNTPDGARVFQEHVWVEDVPEDGYLEFTHTTDFVPFARDAFTQQNDLVFAFPNLPDALPDAQRMRLAGELDGAFGDVAEIRVHLADDGRQVGLFRRHRGTLGLREEIRIPGIIDAGSTYDIELVVDGEELQDFQQRAPQSGAMTVAPARWLPTELLGMFADAQ